jgi:hypothetical protein
MGVLIKADVVEDEKLSFGTKKSGVGDPGLLQIGVGLSSDIAGIATVVLASQWVLDVADQHEGREFRERVDKRRRGVGNQQHVAFVDLLPTTDARSVKPLAVQKSVFSQTANGNRGVLPRPDEVHKTQINRTNALFAAQRENFLGSH